MTIRRAACPETAAQVSNYGILRLSCEQVGLAEFRECPHPRFPVSVASKGLNSIVSRLESTFAGSSGSVDFKGVAAVDAQGARGPNSVPRRIHFGGLPLDGGEGELNKKAAAGLPHST